MLLIHKTLWLVKEAVVVVVGGGGSKYYGHYKMTPPQLQNTRCYLTSPVCTLSGLCISFYFHAFNTKTLWLVKEAVVVVGGVKILWPL